MQIKKLLKTLLSICLALSLTTISSVSAVDVSSTYASGEFMANYGNESWASSALNITDTSDLSNVEFKLVYGEGYSQVFDVSDMDTQS